MDSQISIALNQKLGQSIFLFFGKSILKVGEIFRHNNEGQLRKKYENIKAKPSTEFYLKFFPQLPGSLKII
jgi:hypothetical protein